MIVLNENEFFKNEADAEDRVIISSVKSESKNMEDARYREEILELCRHLEEHKPKGVVGNMKEMFFTITPDTQEWLNESLFGTYFKIGLKRLALIVSEELFAAVSIEQTVDESEKLPFEVKYFESVEEGMAWVKA